MHSKNDLNKDNIKDNDITEYNWWFNTYPLEYAEFLLVTALTRGVWLHPLAANDLGFKHIDVCSDDIYQQNYGNIFIQGLLKYLWTAVLDQRLKFYGPS